MRRLFLTIRLLGMRHHKADCKSALRLAAREIFGLVVAAGLVLGAWCAQGQQEETGASLLASTNSLKTVLGLERSADADVLLLRNGDKLTGALRQASFNLRTSYGLLQFDRRMIAGIDLEGDRNHLESIITVNRNRFSGFLEDRLLVLQPRSGPPVELRCEKVLKIVFQARESERQGIPQRQFILLKNGDFFTGKVLQDQFQVSSGDKQVVFNANDYESIRLGNERIPLAKTVLRNGDVVQGALAIEDIEVDLDVGFKVRVYQDRIDVIYGREGYVPVSLGLTTVHRPGGPDTTNQTAPSSEGKQREGMVWIPPSEFTMGSPPNEADRDLDEGPLTKVTITQGFWMAKCEVTQAEYESVMGVNPSQFTGEAKRPVEKVSWYDALKYCLRLTQLEQAAGKLPAGYAYRLPTEAEWEYACRAGTRTRFSYGDDPGFLLTSEYAWCNGNSGSTTHPVGMKQPNPWGLFDMHGNVLEWCMDSWSGLLPGGSVTNVPAYATGSLRVARGGSWLYEAKFSRSANRDDYGPSNQCSDLGFRIVLAFSQQ
ncbi:MAG: formylglycine-generating enzyme family protein [Verrucomicrobiota bacterium]